MTEFPEDEFDPDQLADDGDWDDDDVFASAPKAINFTEEWEPGHKYRMIVLDKPKLIQGLDTNRKPATWENGSPKMVAVTPVSFNGERRSLWAPKPSALFAAITNASQAAGASVRPNGVLEITYGGLGKKERGKNAPHIFTEVVYLPPNSSRR